MTQTVMPAPVYLSTCLDTVKHAHLGHLWGKVSFLARKMQKQRPGLSAPWLPTDLDLFRTHAVGTKSILKSLSLMGYNRQVPPLATLVEEINLLSKSYSSAHRKRWTAMLIVLFLEINSLYRIISLTSHTATALLVLKENLNFSLIRNYEDFIKF